MNDTAITFSWGWFWATLLGAVLGFVAGEVIESVVTALWARRDRRKRNLPIKMQESNSTWLKRSQTKTNPN
jgi:hypothetical protein